VGDPHRGRAGAAGLHLAPDPRGGAAPGVEAGINR
jgi:hypothetical protein